MKTRSLFLTLALVPSLALAWGERARERWQRRSAAIQEADWNKQASGETESSQTQAVLQAFVDDFLPVDGDVGAAQGGWGAQAGANPGAALAQGAVALGGEVTVGGRTGEVVLAAAKAAVGVRNPEEQAGGVMVFAGAAGALRLSDESVPFPQSADEAHALFDAAFGPGAREGKTFQKRTISGTTFWGHQEWVASPTGRGKIRRTRWVSDFEGVTRAGVGAGSGLLAAFTPLY